MCNSMGHTSLSEPIRIRNAYNWLQLIYYYAVDYAQLRAGFIVFNLLMSNGGFTQVAVVWNGSMS